MPYGDSQVHNHNIVTTNTYPNTYYPNPVSTCYCPSCGQYYLSNSYHACYNPQPVYSTVYTTNTYDYQKEQIRQELEDLRKAVQMLTEALTSKPLPSHNEYEEVRGCDNEGSTDSTSDTGGSIQAAQAGDIATAIELFDISAVKLIDNPSFEKSVDGWVM